MGFEGCCLAEAYCIQDDHRRSHAVLHMCNAGIKYNLRPDPSEPYDPTNEQDIWNKPIHNETVFYGYAWAQF